MIQDRIWCMTIHFGVLVVAMDGWLTFLDYRTHENKLPVISAVKLGACYRPLIHSVSEENRELSTPSHGLYFQDERRQVVRVWGHERCCADWFWTREWHVWNTLRGQDWWTTKERKTHLTLLEWSSMYWCIHRHLFHSKHTSLFHVQKTYSARTNLFRGTLRWPTNRGT